MSVNFDKLPSSNPSNVPAPGFYKFTVTKADMKQGKDTAKPPYLSLSLGLVDKFGKKHGNLFDGQYDSDAPAIQFKLSRFILACGLDLHGSMELKDLAKIVVNRSGVVEVENVPDSRDATRLQAKARLFGSDCYWPLDKFDSLVSDAATVKGTPDADEAFEFSDEDAPVPPAPPVQNTNASEY